MKEITIEVIEKLLDEELPSGKVFSIIYKIGIWLGGNSNEEYFCNRENN